jgi:uncharacterized protein YuzE
MHYRYDPDSDTLTVALKEDIGQGEVADSDEVAKGMVVDYNAAGEIIQFELRNLRPIVNSESKVLRKAA